MAVDGGTQVVTLTLWRFDTLAAKLWMFGQMGLARRAISHMDGLSFFKLVGTGAGAGFSTRPDFSRYGLFCVWRDRQAAEAGLARNQTLQRLKGRAIACVTLFLQPTQTRGQWATREPFNVDPDTEPAGPIVALTRATLKTQHIARFWSLVPAISDAVEREDKQHFMLGLGEVPYRNQITFSIWTDAAQMVHFARTSETHGVAVRRAYEEGWFSEYLFARFNLLSVEGRWPELDDVRHLIAPGSLQNLNDKADRQVAA